MVDKIGIRFHTVSSLLHDFTHTSPQHGLKHTSYLHARCIFDTAESYGRVCLAVLTRITC